MNDEEFIRLVTAHRVIAIVRAGSAESAYRAAEASITGGIKLIEVEMGTPGGFRVISDLLHRYGDRASVGAGSVTAAEQIDRAIKSGAHFISMPHTSTQLVEVCRRDRVVPVVGAMTPTEIAAAWGMGVPLVTLVPAAAVGGPEYVRALMPRLPGIRLCVAGGVASENIVDYFTAGVSAIAVGSRLFPRSDLDCENYTAIAERARGIIRLAGVG
jgi:2-dehydro-3-deoxyphosphogluconate aldolase / (4S)-4-hydroxy-2-oxoglutarate aldolase